MRCSGALALTDHSPPPSAKAKNERSYTSTLPYAFTLLERASVTKWSASHSGIVTAREKAARKAGPRAYLKPVGGETKPTLSEIKSLSSIP